MLDSNLRYFPFFITSGIQLLFHEILIVHSFTK